MPPEIWELAKILLTFATGIMTGWMGHILATKRDRASWQQQIRHDQLAWQRETIKEFITQISAEIAETEKDQKRLKKTKILFLEIKTTLDELDMKIVQEDQRTQLQTELITRRSDIVKSIELAERRISSLETQMEKRKEVRSKLMKKLHAIEHE